MLGSRRADGPAPSAARPGGGGCGTTRRTRRARGRGRSPGASSRRSDQLADVALELLRPALRRVLGEDARAGAAPDRRELLRRQPEEAHDVLRLRGDEDLLARPEERL